jgi:hypothetical protein
MLLYMRLWLTKEKGESITTTLVEIWVLLDPTANPPNAQALPSVFPHIRQYAIDIAYIAPPDPQETMKRFKQCIYSTFFIIITTDNGKEAMQILLKYPDIPRSRVWANLHVTNLPDRVKSGWYAAMHNIIPTNERLTNIHLATTSACSRCGVTNTILHRITQCEEGPVIWNWTRARIAMILRIHPKYISEDYTLRPCFQHWPPQRHAAIVWIIPHLVAYRLQTQRRLIPQ